MLAPGNAWGEEGEVMAIANPRLHIICGICGCNKMLRYEVKQEEDGVTVYVSCKNCASLTALDEVMPEEVKK